MKKITKIQFMFVLSFFFLIGGLFNLSVAEDMPIKVFSPNIKNRDYIPVKYTCDGNDISPKIVWTHFPKRTKSFVLIMEDPDAPVGIFTHWIVYDIPAHINHISQNFPKIRDIGKIKQGLNDFGYIGYGGPCPPRGDKAHRYYFKIYALDIQSLDIRPEKATRNIVLEKIQNHIIAEGYLMGYYKRKR